CVVDLQPEAMGLPPIDRSDTIPNIERNFLTSEPVMITSKLTSKAQTTIPQPVRAALKLQEGDELLYVVEGDRVILTKARRGALVDDPFRTFSEWHSEADEKAYGGL